jgi:hypothetical protein
MNGQEKTGWTIVALILLLLWWLSKSGILHGGVGSSEYTTSVQSGILGGQQNEPTVTQYPGGNAPTPCCG